MTTGGVALCGWTIALAPTDLALAVAKEGRGDGGRAREGWDNNRERRLR